MEGLLQRLEPFAYSVLVLLGSVVAGLFLHSLIFRVIARIARRTANRGYESLVKHLSRPSRVTIPLVMFYIALQLVYLPPAFKTPVDKITEVILKLAIAWVLVGLTFVFEDIILARFNIADRENLRARKMYTRINIIRKIIFVAILIVTLSAVLLSFQKFRKLGTGLLASAGLAGIVLGVAARPVLSNLLAGIQIAFTEPIRLDDVVVVENEWGRIEEITLTYVVVKTWDLRHLVLPIGYFLEKPFSNWTRHESDLIASVNIYADYTVPVDKVRSEFLRILRESQLWKGDVGSLQVIDATEKTMQLRAIMDAQDSSSAWDLRCEVREKLLGFLQRNFPDALPKFRIEQECRQARQSD